MTNNKTHPSYGVIQLTRVNGRRGCFMSQTQGPNYVTLTIEQAEYISEGRALGTKRLVEIRMTCAQYLELISSFNIGSGTPCTISYLQGPVEEYEPEPSPYDDIASSLQEEFNAIKLDGSDITDYLDSLKTKGRASKSDINEIERLVENLIRKVNSNIPYLATICAEAISKYVQGAKCELLAYTSRLFDKRH